jgi:CRP-like cAMP-binding protein
METKRFAKGDVIFRQGEISACMYDIRSGSVGIFAGLGTGEQTQLVRFGPGDTFGETEFIASCPRMASAVALEETEALEIDEERFSSYFSDKPEKILSLMRQLSRRVRETTEGYLEACRTVYETVETDRTGKKRDAELKERLSFFRRVGRLFR